MDYLLDTNIIVIYSRDNDVSREIERRYKLFTGQENRLAVSVITLGELDALIKKLNLGERRRAKIEQILENITVTGIEFEEVISMYGDIDAFSQGKLPSNTPFSARNMGKNDIWIAATANVYDLVLVTTDKDFDHLSPEMIDLKFIDLEEVRR